MGVGTLSLEASRSLAQCMSPNEDGIDDRYGPRPKQPPYSPQGTLNLEVKFAPFASHPRRAPLRVCHLIYPVMMLTSRTRNQYPSQPS